MYSTITVFILCWVPVYLYFLYDTIWKYVLAICSDCNVNSSRKHMIATCLHTVSCRIVQLRHLLHYYTSRYRFSSRCRIMYAVGYGRKPLLNRYTAYYYYIPGYRYCYVCLLQYAAYMNSKKISLHSHNWQTTIGTEYQLLPICTTTRVFVV